MIDYLMIKLLHPHQPIPSGSVISVSPDGSLDWEAPKAMEVAGSYDHKLWVRSRGALDDQGRAEELHIKGNPAKFLQGHNVFGSDDIIGLITAIIERVGQSVPIGTVTKKAVRSAVVSRIDFTRSIQFDTEQQAKAYIRQHGTHAKTRSGRGNDKKDTCTFQKGSRRWSLVMYHKGEELKAHKLNANLPTTRLQEEADRLCRVELRLLGLELEKLNLRTASKLTPNRLQKIYEAYLMKIELNSAIEIPSEVLLAMPRCYRDTYQLWRAGIDVAQTMKNDTMYRHQRYLKQHGINIFVPCIADEYAEVIPMKRILKGRAYEIPQWAIDEGIVFQQKSSLSGEVYAY